MIHYAASVVIVALALADPSQAFLFNLGGNRCGCAAPAPAPACPAPPPCALPPPPPPAPACCNSPASYQVSGGAGGYAVAPGASASAYNSRFAAPASAFGAPAGGYAGVPQSFVPLSFAPQQYNAPIQGGYIASPQVQVPPQQVQQKFVSEAAPISAPAPVSQQIYLEQPPPASQPQVVVPASAPAPVRQNGYAPEEEGVAAEYAEEENHYDEQRPATEEVSHGYSKQEAAIANPVQSYAAEEAAISTQPGYKRRHRAIVHAAKTLDPKCNSAQLREILNNNIKESTAFSKRAVARAAKTHFNTNFDVVCSTGDFSYLANTRLFCEAKVENITCFAFEH